MNATVIPNRPGRSPAELRRLGRLDDFDAPPHGPAAGPTGRPPLRTAVVPRDDGEVAVQFASVPKQNTATDVGLSRKDIHAAGGDRSKIPNENFATASDIGLTHKDIQRRPRLGFHQSRRGREHGVFSSAGISVR